MLSKEEVEHIALLARIGLEEDETERYRKDLSGVLDFFRELETADTDSAAVPRQIVGRENGLRGDVLGEKRPVDPAAILRNVPEMKDGFVKVKSIL